MKTRETITLNVNPVVAKAFREVVGQFGGKVGACATAAMALFVRATDEQRQRILQEVYTAELEGKVDQLLAKPRSESGKRG